ncbi:VOC family protein [Arthrobacter agilis]|uniref:VOC family protein n=1 Tax=Arthrobacter agilis TaxID=37921 RepID=UPI0027851516|nr:VOC family protein [Arthrobacter agilis]MDQ0734957.1 hypothetical protein [Arthrobacter agilis]
MYLENLVVDAVEPQRLGRFWEAVVGGETLTDEPDVYETRLTIEGGPVLDLCFQRVHEPSSPPRLHVDLRSGPGHAEEVDRLLALGARHLDVGQGRVPWVVLADPEGNPCCVMDERTEDYLTGPIAALPLDSSGVERDARFWSWLTGWTRVPGGVPTLRHPSQRGPLLELCPEPAPKGAGKNPLHLDVRLEAGDDPDDVAAGIIERGGRELRTGWGDLPWRIYADPSGNELCVLPARS